MSANETHEEDQRSYRRHFNQWRYPLSLNCHLCISEVIDRFTQVEKEKGLRSRERKRREREKAFCVRRRKRRGGERVA